MCWCRKIPNYVTFARNSRDFKCIRMSLANYNAEDPQAPSDFLLAPQDKPHKAHPSSVKLHFHFPKMSLWRSVMHSVFLCLIWSQFQKARQSTLEVRHKLSVKFPISLSPVALTVSGSLKTLKPVVSSSTHSKIQVLPLQSTFFCIQPFLRTFTVCRI